MIYVLLILICFLFNSISALLYAKLILWKMEQDLETWISYKTGDDIFRCPESRQEYQYYAKQLKNKDNPERVLTDIRKDLRSSKLLKPIYFNILFLLLKGKKFK